MWKIYLLALITFLVGTSQNSIAGIMDKIAESLNVSVVATGQLITVYSLANALGTPFLIGLTGRLERRKLLIYALGVFVIANLLTFILPGFEWLIAARILAALGAGIVVVNLLTVASKIAPPAKVGSSIAIVLMGFTLSLIVGVPLGRLVASYYDWRTIFVGIGVLGLLAMLIIYFVIPQSNGETPIPLRKQLTLLREPRIFAALAATFFWIGGYAIAYTYISPFLLTVTGLKEGALSTALFVFGLASLIGSQFGGYSTDRWGVKPTLIGGFTLHIVSLILLSLFSHSAMAVFVVLILWSFSAWTTGPTQQYNLISLAPEASGIMLGLNSSFLQLAMAAGAGIGGLVVTHLSLAAIPLIGAIGVVFAIFSATLSFRFSRTRQQQLAKGLQLN
ncbi:MFS transporter [Brevibacillus ginsengisoli]|uniref:MFS transporter n=1 Tax=Brevibacillus ginsengisoli TaxID=363854 RepID=UPI003CF3E9AA